MRQSRLRRFELEWASRRFSLCDEANESDSAVLLELKFAHRVDREFFSIQHGAAWDVLSIKVGEANAATVGHDLPFEVRAKALGIESQGEGRLLDLEVRVGTRQNFTPWRQMHEAGSKVGRGGFNLPRGLCALPIGEGDQSVNGFCHNHDLAQFALNREKAGMNTPIN
jgi:hypothetical protein